MPSEELLELKAYLEVLKKKKQDQCSSEEEVRRNSVERVCIADKALTLVFSIGVNGKKEELKEIVMDDDLAKSIHLCIETTACHFYTRLNTSILLKRSALQFLIDVCCDESVKNKFETSTRILDGIIAGTSLPATPEPQYLAIPNHSWWSTLSV